MSTYDYWEADRGNEVWCIGISIGCAIGMQYCLAFYVARQLLFCKKNEILINMVKIEDKGQLYSIAIAAYLFIFASLELFCWDDGLYMVCFRFLMELYNAYSLILATARTNALRAQPNDESKDEVIKDHCNIYHLALVSNFWS